MRGHEGHNGVAQGLGPRGHEGDRLGQYRGHEGRHTHGVSGRRGGSWVAWLPGCAHGELHMGGTRGCIKGALGVDMMRVGVAQEGTFVGAMGADVM